ncbi:MAG: leucine-rich repeat protein [Coriobacteriia bacterium]|nr:leucine-rich repeat protein [Coriobacteriia bacterium]
MRKGMRLVNCFLVVVLAFGLLPHQAFATEVEPQAFLQGDLAPEPAPAPVKEPAPEKPAAKEQAPEKPTAKEPPGQKQPEEPEPVEATDPSKGSADSADGTSGSNGNSGVGGKGDTGDGGSNSSSANKDIPANGVGFATAVSGSDKPNAQSLEDTLLSRVTSDATETAAEDTESLPAGVVFAAGGLLYKVLDAGRVEVSGWISSLAASGSLVLPSAVTDPVGNTYKVVAISQAAFENKADLTALTIPGTVTTISNQAFRGCSRLTQVSLPGSLVSLGNHAFASTALASVTLPGSLREIGNQAFRDCKITRISIPASVTHIGIDAFYNNPLGQAVFEGRRVDHTFPAGTEVYLTVTFRTQGGSVVAVRAVPEGAPLTVDAVRIPDVLPVQGMNGYWQAEEGFSLYEPITDSFSVYAVYVTETIVDIGGAVVAPIPPQAYTAYEVRPSVLVAHGGRILHEGTDYALTYTDNIEVGDRATVTIWGQGIFKGKVTFTFSIYRDPDLIIDIGAARIESIPPQGFLGRPIEPVPVVRLGTRVLVLGRDYTVAYANNYWVGTATVIVNGTGGYNGSCISTFAITTDASTPDGRVSLATIDAVIALAEGVDPTLYTSHSVALMDAFLEGARVLRARAVAENWVALDQQQNLINEATRLLYVSYMNLETRTGELVTVVVWAPDAMLYATPFDGGPVPIRALPRGTVFFARLDYEAADAFWYVVAGVGYVRAADVFAHPIEGMGEPYDVACMAESVVARAYPFDWAQVAATYGKQTVLTVRTVSDEWLRVVAVPGGPGGGPGAPATLEASGTPVVTGAVPSYIRARDVMPVDGSFPPPGSPANPLPPGGGDDPNKADPNEHNPEERSPEIPGHGIGGTGGDPRGLVPIDWWPASNATGISRFARLWVKFPNNISDPGDSAINVTKVALFKADGTRVPTRNYTLSRDLYPDSRRYIYIQPTQPLDWGTRYYIEVLPGFRARNGSVSAVSLVIPFSTEPYPYARGEGDAPPPTLAPSGNGIGFWADPDPDPPGPGDPDPPDPDDPDLDPKGKDGKVFGGTGDKGFSGSNRPTFPGDGGPPDGYGPAPGPGYSVAGTALGTMANALTRTARDNQAEFSGLVPAINTPRAPRSFPPAPQAGSGAATARLDGTEGGDTMPPAASGVFSGVALAMAASVAWVFFSRRKRAA